MNRQNPKEMAIHISGKRKLKYDRIDEGKEIVSIRFYYLFEKFKYYFYVDAYKKEGNWEFRPNSFDANNTGAMTIKYLQEQQETIEQIDYLVDSIMEGYKTE